MIFELGSNQIGQIAKWLGRIEDLIGRSKAD